MKRLTDTQHRESTCFEEPNARVYISAKDNLECVMNDTQFVG